MNPALNNKRASAKLCEDWTQHLPPLVSRAFPQRGLAHIAISTSLIAGNLYRHGSNEQYSSGRTATKVDHRRQFKRSKEPGPLRPILYVIPMPWETALIGPAMRLFERLLDALRRRDLSVVEARWRYESGKGRYALSIAVKNTGTVALTLDQLQVSVPAHSKLRDDPPRYISMLGDDHDAIRERSLGVPCDALLIDVDLAVGQSTDFSFVLVPPLVGRKWHSKLVLVYTLHGARERHSHLVLRRHLSVV